MPQTISLSLKEFMLLETVDNFFISDRKARLKWMDKVWEVLQSSYASIGGIKGSGFESKESMVKNIPMWKIIRRGEDVKAIMMYKDKEGRKRVAAGTDGSPEGKQLLAQLFKEEARFQRGWGEISGPSLRFMKKIFTEKEFADMLIPFERVKELLKKDYEAGKLREIPGEKYEFEHKLGSDWIAKVAIGNPGKELYDPRT